MSEPRFQVIHCLNQFFGGLGGEEMAGCAPSLVQGARGPGLLLEQLFPELDVAATLIFGDNHVAANQEAAVAEILDLLAPLFADKEKRADLVLAGPAFNAGRYGISCGALCQTVQERFGVVAVPAMYPDNPGVDAFGRDLFIARATENVLGMAESLKRLGNLGLKLLHGETPDPEGDDCLFQGRRENIFVEKSGACRAVEMLLDKVAGHPFTTEYRMPVFDRVAPAAPVSDITRATLALVTSGGIVPAGNPDRIEAANAQKFGTYSLAELSALTSRSHQTAHGGYDPTYANENPNRILPLDAVRELEEEGAIGRLHPTYYATVGNATSVTNAKNFGASIAEKLLEAGVQAVILTST